MDHTVSRGMEEGSFVSDRVLVGGRAGGEGAIKRIKSYGISRDSTQYDLVITSPIARILGRLLSSNVIEAQSEVSNRDSFFMRYSCSPV